MRVALIGSRGIPARYSGFETFYEELGVRLAGRGHDVTVYNRSHFIKEARDEYRGVRIVSLPSIRTKHLDTISHTFVASMHALRCRYDIVYYCIVGNSPLVWIPRLRGARILLNVDGQDWTRKKWGRFARWYQRQCERIATRTPDVVISDAHGVAKHYLGQYGKESVFVPYGANTERDEGVEALRKWGLSPREYVFYVGRFVPENAIDTLIEAFAGVKTDKRLVIVGDAPYMASYKRQLEALARADDRVVFTGYAFGEDYAQLSSHAYLAVQPSAVDGTRPALLDQLGFGNCVVVRDTAVNMEVIADAGCSFRHDAPVADLRRVLQELNDDPRTVQSCRDRAQQRIENYYNWEWITGFYEDLFDRMVRSRRLVSYDTYLDAQGVAGVAAPAPAPRHPLSRTNVLGVGVHALDMPEAVDSIVEAAREGRRGYVCVTSVHGVMESHRDVELKRIHNRSFLTVPDGMPTVWTGHGQGFWWMNRVYGPDLMFRVLQASTPVSAAQARGPQDADHAVGRGSRQRALSHFFYGATEDVLARLTANVKQRIPGLRVAGTYAPPFRPLNEDEQRELVALVERSRPDLFWVGLSTPKQERFMAEYAPRLGSTVMLGVGAAFDLHAGLRKDAPNWMKRAGLQWFHRLAQEPRRLWKRYLYIVPAFMVLMTLQRLGLRTYTLDVPASGEE